LRKTLTNNKHIIKGEFMANKVVAKKAENATVHASAKTVGEKTKIRGFVELIKSSWEIFTQGWVQTSVLIAIMFAVLFIIGVITFGPIIWTIITYNGKDLFPTIPTNNIGMLLIGIVLFIIVEMFMAVAIERSVIKTASNDKENINASILFALKNFLPLMGLLIVEWVMVTIGSIFLIVPGIIIALMYYLISMVYIAEGKRGFAVFSRSAELTKGYRWAILGRIVLFGLIASLAFLILSITIQGSGLVIDFFIIPLELAYVYSIYEDLVSIKG